jgi:hypothetical protein
MKAIVYTSVVILLAGCATTAPEPGEQSIFDVIEEAEAAPRPGDTCTSGGVKYCVGNGSFLERCGCADAFDVQKALDRVL